MDRLAHYRILSAVGRGATAVVYKALDTERDTVVALKVLSGALVEDKHALERLRREAEAIARLRHPNIVALYEVGDAGGVPYLAMEFVVGRTLARVLKEEGNLVAEQTMHIAIGVTNALCEAHGEGIVHRDIKPGNILLAAPPSDGETGGQGEGETPLTPSPLLPFSPSGHRDWGVVKVTDFGLAKEAERSSLTETGSVLGTVNYISPEQIEGHRADGRSDLYALGAVMYEMLAGRPPFVGENVSAVLYKHVSEQPQPLRELDPRIPQELEAIVLRLLEKRPEERYPSADALVADLKRFQEGRTVGAPARERGGGRFLARMVGREDVFERLKARLDRAISGEGGLVVIAGEAGIGKTRLAEEVGEYARGRNVRFLSGGCLWGEGTEPYHPFGRILREYFGIVEEDPASLRMKKVKVFVERTPDLKEVLPDVEPLLSGRGESMRDGGTNRDLWRRSVLFGGVARVLVRMSRRRPLLIFIDDLHWARWGTVDMLTHVVRRTRGVRILFLGAYRPEECTMNYHYTPQEDLKGDKEREAKEEGAHPLIQAIRALSREGLCEQVQLGRLRLEEVSQMVRELTGGLDLPGAFLKKLHKETEGNPLFLLETLKLLRDEGAIEERNGWWKLTGEMVSSDSLPIPRAVYEVMVRRIERLSPEDRKLLECAAVEGEVFSSDVLCEVLGLERMAVLPRLRDLEQVYQIIHGAGRGYRFDHTKIRDVLYEGLSEELRAEIHRGIGGLKENRSQEPVFELAYHFFRAGDLEKAIGYLIRAGERAQALYAGWDAVGYYRDALRCLGQLPGDPGDRALRVYEGLGDTYYALGELERAAESYEQALGICRDRRKRADLHRKTGWVHQHRHQAEGALRCMEQARAELEGEDRTAECGVRSAECGVSKTSIRTPKPVLSEVEGSELRNSVEMARVCIDTAQILRFDEVDYERALEYDRRALEILEGTGRSASTPTKELSEAYRGVGFYYATFGGEVEKGMDYLQKSLKISEGMGDLYEMGLTYGIFREVFKFRGDSENAIQCMQRALEVARRIGHRYWEAGHGASLASEYKYSGDIDRAFEYYEQSRRICEQEGYVFPLVGCLGSLGQIYALRGDREMAIRCFKDGIEKTLESGRRHLTVSICLAACLRRLERILREEGKEQAFVTYCREMTAKRSEDVVRVGLTQWRLEPMPLHHRPLEEVFLDRFETERLSPGWRWIEDPKEAGLYHLSPGKGGAECEVQSAKCDLTPTLPVNGEGATVPPFTGGPQGGPNSELRTPNSLEIRVRRKEVISRSDVLDHEPVLPALPFDPARLCRPVQGDFAVEVRIAQADPGSKRSGGLIVYRDRDTYVILMVDELDELYLYGKFEGTPEILGRGTFGPSAGQLRIEREGDTFTAWCSDGAAYASKTDWSRAGQVTFEMGDPVQVGLYAYSHPTVREAVLRCTDFRILKPAETTGVGKALPFLRPSAPLQGGKGARGTSDLGPWTLDLGQGKVSELQGDEAKMEALKEQQLALLCRVGRMVNSTLDLKEVLSSAVRAAVEATGAERGMVLLLDEQGAPQVSAPQEVDPETAQDAERISRGILEQASQSGEPVITLDARTDPRFSDRESVRIYGIRSVMCVPLRVRDRTIGMVYLDHRGAGGVFQPDDGPFYIAVADQLALAVENARLHEQLKQEVVHLREEVGEQYRFDRILGKSKRMREVFRTLERVIPTSVTVLLRGESGTGKELVARAIHYNGPRKEKRFVAQNCAALPESLLESELFGYRKGAFTGAAQDKKGLFEVADGGTLFLDEIVDMSPGLQSRLLRVLEEGCIRRLGETEPRPVDVRVISATNRDLEKELKEGRFRKDLYYRLNVVGIELPPLRERTGDLPLLAAHFLKRFSKEMDKPIQGFSRDAMDRLLTYPWPGNVRELEHGIEQAVVLSRGHTISVEDLPGSLRDQGSDAWIEEERSLKEARAEFEKAFLERVLRKHRGNITRAAQVIGLDRANLYGKIRRYGINVEGMRRDTVKRKT